MLPAAALIWVPGRKGGARGREPPAPRVACAEDPPLCHRCHHRQARLAGAAAATRAGGSLTRGRAKGAGACGDAEPRGGAGVWGGAGSCRALPSWHRALALPAVGGTKGPLRHPRSSGGAASPPPSPHCAGAGSQWGSTRGVRPRGLGGCTQCRVPLAGGCHSGEWPGVAPHTPPGSTSHPGTSAPLPAPPPPDKRLKVRLCQLPSPGRAGGVTAGRGPAPCPPRPPTAPAARRWQHRHFPGVPGRCWHQAPRQHREGARPQQPEQHRRAVARQKGGVQQEDDDGEG